MNNEIVVPIDITQEEKSILAVLSMRQFFFLFPTLVFCGVILIYGNLPFLDGGAEWIGKLIIIVILGGISSFLAFFKFEKYEQYASEFIAWKIKFHRSQKTYSHI
ncbi:MULTISPECIES: PrgI family mobile element protein [unclassified Paenibacillus]|uniref:PrgI family mobile element protein n=1 Tax=Paenibacillus provencensis TaxID=441151 RepID=A0ABW3QBP2_9BACL|nr:MULTISPECIES: PrgI family protein [unclassified Paenibacillus]MCM3130194.1 PrgI family protein [Paenibacillus sp. MER 78]SDX71451.1 PrgI family protein [Paenibacillus sp. PDC88]SFS88730.1 PrgI family protein [Paenibacillus sp. 453mf]